MTGKPVNPDQHSRIVMLAFGKMEHGGNYWCYVSVKPSRYDDYQRRLATKQYNMQNFVADGFGEVIVSGEGNLPPQDVTKKVAQMFGIPIKELFAQAEPKQAAMDKVNALKIDDKKE